MRTVSRATGGIGRDRVHRVARHQHDVARAGKARGPVWLRTSAVHATASRSGTAGFSNGRTADTLISISPLNEEWPIPVRLQVYQPGQVSTGCGSCHSAQGFLVYLNQLQNGLASRTIPAIPLTPDTVQPQTCATCHDPHAVGASSGGDNTATVRVTDNTPMLPGGFAATGVGRGAVCIVCHNSRNGEKSAGSGNPGLHQDGDPQWNTLTSYSAPHEACQGDVLMGKNAYFVGNGDMRSPHSLITDTCATCHMELTPPPPLLSYNLSGTNHTFRASPEICIQCHGINQAIASNLQEAVTAELELLRGAIERPDHFSLYEYRCASHRPDC